MTLTDPEVEVDNVFYTLSDDVYNKVELYTDVFNNISNSSIVVAGQFGGPVLAYDKSKVTILTCSGVEISQWKWKNAAALAAGWSQEEEPVFVLEDGTILIYSMFGIFKHQINMGDDAKDHKILSAKIYPSYQGTGVAILTTTHRFYVVSSIKEPRLMKFYDCGELSSPGAWCPLSYDKQSRLAVALSRGSEIVLISDSDMSVLEVEIQSPGVLSNAGKVVLVSTSESQTKICAVMDTGHVWLGTLAGTIRRHHADIVASSAVWCGEEMVMLFSDTGSTWLHVSGETEMMFQPASLCVVQEKKAVRVISRGFHDLFHQVDKTVSEIDRGDTSSAGAILLSASRELAAKSYKADEYIRLIMDKLPVAISQCIQAAGALFQPYHQKELMRAAKFGIAFLKAGDSTEAFYKKCTTLKLLNNVRHYKVGMPLTQVQLEALTIPVLIDRLIARRLFPLALEIVNFLKLPPAEGSSRILAHWALYKVESSVSVDESETARMISSRLGERQSADSGISYSDIAEKAADCGREQLAVQLLEHEVRPDKQVPLLMKLGQGPQALRKAIYSGDTDLVYHVILALQSLHSQAEFQMIIRQDPVASKLYTLYCRQHSPDKLSDWLRQEDDFAAMARISFTDSYSTGTLESRLSQLVTAQEQYKKSREDFNASVAEENYRLLKYQSGLEDKFGEPFINLSVYETLIKLIGDKEIKIADKFRSDFKISDRKYFWLKVRAFGDTQQWSELSGLVKNKRSPIGFEPFINICLKHGAESEAKKYLQFCSNEEKLRACVKLGRIQEAAEAAFLLRNYEALCDLERRANNNVPLLEIIANYKQKLI